MTKPSAIQVLLAKRLGLPATASKTEVCAVALSRLSRSATFIKIASDVRDDYPKNKQCATCGATCHNGDRVKVETSTDRIVRCPSCPPEAAPKAQGWEGRNWTDRDQRRHDSR